MPSSPLNDLIYGDALAYAQQRRVLLPEQFYGELPMQKRALAFTVSGLAGMDQIQAVLDSLNKTLREGGTFKTWRASLPASAGLLPAHHLDNVFRTNIQQAYAAGRWEQMSRNFGRRPYLLYDAVNDSRTRPAHRAMDGHIARYDAPIWKTWTPPCGFRCRCRTIALTEAEAQKRGLGKLAPAVDPDQGWAYDRRQAWQASAQRAVAGRQRACLLPPASGSPAWCGPGPAAALLARITADLQTEAPARVLAWLDARLGPAKLAEARAALASRQALRGALEEHEALSLWAWSLPNPDPEAMFKRVGRVLRQAPHRPQDEKLLGELRYLAPLIHGMQQAVAKLPGADTVLWRGLDPERWTRNEWARWKAAHLRVGAVIQHNGFSSLSSEPSVARRYAGTEGWVVQVHGSKARNIGLYTFENESEFLAPQFEQYRVLSVDRRKRLLVVQRLAVPTLVPVEHQFSSRAMLDSAACLDASIALHAVHQQLAEGTLPSLTAAQLAVAQRGQL